MTETPAIWHEQSERATLGAMLINSNALAVAAERLTANDFYHPRHGRVFTAAVDLHRAGGGVDAITVAGQLDDADDQRLARSVPSDVPAVTNAALYIDRVADDAQRRRIVQAAAGVQVGARNGGVTQDQRDRLIEALSSPQAVDAPFSVFTTAALATIPPPEYLLGDYLIAGALNVQYGPSDRFKSFTAVDWGCTIASGGSWFGRYTKPGPVVYIAGEGGSGLWQRVEAWAEHRQCEPPELHWITEAINLFDQAAADAFDTWITRLPIPPVLIIFDTLARCMPGADENSSRDMGIVINRLDMLRHRHGSAILVIHHTGHADQTRERGSSALLGAADCRIKASGEDPLSVELTVVKVKDAARPEAITLHLEPVRRSLVIARASTRRETRIADLRQSILDYLAEHPASTQNAIEKGAGKNAQAIRDTLMSLIDTGEVVRTEGPNNSYLHTIPSASDPADAPGRTTTRHADVSASSVRPLKADALDAPSEPTSQVRPTIDADGEL